MHQQVTKGTCARVCAHLCDRCCKSGVQWRAEKGRSVDDDVDAVLVFDTQPCVPAYTPTINPTATFTHM